LPGLGLLFVYSTDMSIDTLFISSLIAATITPALFLTSLSLLIVLYISFIIVLLSVNITTFPLLMFLLLFVMYLIKSRMLITSPAGTIPLAYCLESTPPSISLSCSSDVIIQCVDRKFLSIDASNAATTYLF